MTQTRTDDLQGIVAKEPEHCDDCLQLIRPGERYSPTIEQAVVCSDCIGEADATQLSGGLAAEVQDGRLLVRLTSAEAEVLPHEVRHLV